MSSAPVELLDPEGEGIYLNAETEQTPSTLLRAARIFFGDWREWRNVDIEIVYMRPQDGRDEWVQVSPGRFPFGWRLNLPRRWRPVAFVYCTPTPSGPEGRPE